jgi:hypothetical protein
MKQAWKSKKINNMVEDLPITETPVIQDEVIPFADITTEYAKLSNDTDENKNRWLEREKARIELAMQSANDTEKIPLAEELAIIETEMGLLRNKAKEEQLADDPNAPIDDTRIADTPVGFSDLTFETLKNNNPLAFSDIETITEDLIANELNSLYDFKKSTMLALSDLGAESVDTLKDAVSKVNKHALDVEARGYIYKCISDPECKITEAMQDWGVDFYKKDKEGFIKYIANAPVAFSQNTPDVVQPKNIAKCSKSQEELALIFGNDPKETYIN